MLVARRIADLGYGRMEFVRCALVEHQLVRNLNVEEPDLDDGLDGATGDDLRRWSGGVLLTSPLARGPHRHYYYVSGLNNPWTPVRHKW